MADMNKVLNEKIKGKILELLMKNDLSFSGLLKQLKIRDHGQLNYHLKSLISEGIVEKKDQMYCKTQFGERMGVYINQFQSREFYPISVVCAIVQDSEGKILLLRRAKSPQKGKWGFPGGKIALGERLSQAAEREVFEETGIRAKFDRAAGFFPSLVYAKNELSYHANIIPVFMKPVRKDTRICVDKCENDEFCFFNKNEVNKIDLIVNNKYILDKVFSQEFSFKELVSREN